MTEIITFKPPADTLRLCADRDWQPGKYTILTDPDTGQDDYLAWFFEDPWAGAICVTVPIEQVRTLIAHFELTIAKSDEIRAIHKRNQASNEEGQN